MTDSRSGGGPLPPSPWAGVPAEDFGDDDVTVTVDTLASGSFFGDRFRV